MSATESASEVALLQWLFQHFEVEIEFWPKLPVGSRIVLERWLENTGPNAQLLEGLCLKARCTCGHPLPLNITYDEFLTHYMTETLPNDPSPTKPLQPIWYFEKTDPVTCPTLASPSSTPSRTPTSSSSSALSHAPTSSSSSSSSSVVHTPLTTALNIDDHSVHIPGSRCVNSITDSSSSFLLARRS